MPEGLFGLADPVLDTVLMQDEPLRGGLVTAVLLQETRRVFRSLTLWFRLSEFTSAVTRSIETSWSIDNLRLRMIQPIPSHRRE
jgi:hypothetical protein